MRIPSVLLPLLILLASACGRRATESDCSLILDRNVEIQMRAMKIYDPAEIDRQKQQLREAKKDELSPCIGKRITDATVQCVREAESAEAIDACFR